MRRRTLSLLLTLFLLPALACAPVQRLRPTATAAPLPATAQPTPAASTPAPATVNRFGVLVGAGKRPDMLQYVADLGGSWVRLNAHLDGNGPNIAQYLDAGLNVIITLDNHDPANSDTAYGALDAWPNAGFPYKSKAAYQQRLRDILAPLTPYLAAGRQVWAQAENEVGDAAVNDKAKYWRGTTDQYLTQLDAFYEAVRGVDPSIRVVLTSFPSETLDALIDPAHPRHDYVVSRVSELLAHGNYDAVDLHFYGCAADIPAKARWFTDRLPPGKQWISSELSGPDSRCPSTPLTWAQDLNAFEQAQAAEVPARLNACARAGGAVCLWFSLFDLKNEVDVFNHLGLLDPRQTPPRAKPAYAAFKSFVAQSVSPAR